MSQEIAEKFIAALRKLEESSEAEEIVALYSDDAEIANVVAPNKFSGQDGAREFWTKYRETFGEMRSEFRNRIYGEKSAALEWTTRGQSSNSHEVCYSGVTILEIDNDKITRSCAYFNAEDLDDKSKKARRPSKIKLFQLNSVGKGKPESTKARSSRTVKTSFVIKPRENQARIANLFRARRKCALRFFRRALPRHLDLLDWTFRKP